MTNSDTARPDRYKAPDAASSYDETIRNAGLFRRWSHHKELHALQRALSRISGASVLDGPCGTGRIHEVLAQRFVEVASMDSSESMLRVHQRNSSSGVLCCGNIFNLPFADASFDWVVCYRLFHHIQNHEQRVALLKSVRRVGRQGIVFSAWIDTPVNRRRGSRRRSLTRKDIDVICTEAGLKITHIDFASWPFQPKCVVTCDKL